MPSTFSGTSGSIDRKALKRPDEFVQAVRKFFDSLGKSSGLVLGLAIAVLAVGLAVALWISNSRQMANDAREALFEARQVLDRELIAVADEIAPAPKKPAKGAQEEPQLPQSSRAETIAYAPFDVDAKLSGSVKALSGVAEEHGSTRAGFEAMMILANLYFDHGHPEQAGDWFMKASEKAPEKLDQAIALSGLGKALENAGKNAEAAGAYERALKLNVSSLQGELLLSQARAWELSGDQERAKAAYDQVLSQLPNTEHAKTAAAYKALLK